MAMAASLFASHQPSFHSCLRWRAVLNTEDRSLLCLSNGHGEDAIAASILKQFKKLVMEKTGKDIKIDALPLVGAGTAYEHSSIRIIGPRKVMPSGGFIYMDAIQLFRDLLAGLVSLTFEQWCAIVAWVDRNPNGVILSVGDVFPLGLAWLASKASKRIEYSFVGTAKSEYYVHGNDSQQNIRLSYVFSNSVYYPWERILMADGQCRFIAPRDGLTCLLLQQCLPALASLKVHDLGNAMMDDLYPTGVLDFLRQCSFDRVIVLLPGSREPEAYSNWGPLLAAIEEVSATFAMDKLIFLAPIVPCLGLDQFETGLIHTGWSVSEAGVFAQNFGSVDKSYNRMQGNSSCGTSNRQRCKFVSYVKKNMGMLLLRGGFGDCCYWANAGIAMAGTATEQLVGLGKPVFTIPGNGPQFTSKFAEAQSRLLGKSVLLCTDAVSLATTMKEILLDDTRLIEIAKNGLLRMGKPGASQRIAELLITTFY